MECLQCDVTCAGFTLMATFHSTSICDALMNKCWVDFSACRPRRLFHRSRDGEPR